MTRRTSASVHVLQTEAGLTAAGPPSNDILAQIETRQQQQQQTQHRRQTRCSILHGLPGLQDRRASRRPSAITPGLRFLLISLLAPLLKMPNSESFAMTIYMIVFVTCQCRHICGEW